MIIICISLIYFCCHSWKSVMQCRRWSSLLAHSGVTFSHVLKRLFLTNSAAPRTFHLARLPVDHLCFIFEAFSQSFYSSLLMIQLNIDFVPQQASQCSNLCRMTQTKSRLLWVLLKFETASQNSFIIYLWYLLSNISFDHINYWDYNLCFNSICFAWVTFCHRSTNPCWYPRFCLVSCYFSFAKTLWIFWHRLSGRTALDFVDCQSQKCAKKVDRASMYKSNSTWTSFFCRLRLRQHSIRMRISQVVFHYKLHPFLLHI